MASAAPVASDGAATTAPDGGADAGNLENGRALAPGRRAAPAVTELRLPWSAGETWYLTSGPHSNRRSALDFAPPNLDPRTGKLYADPCSRKRGDAYWVRAAADGYFTAVLRKGCPCVQIQHDDGTTTNYFHLRRSSVKRLGFKVGDPVRAGQALGHPSCEVGPRKCGATHPASGVHVHFHRTNAATAARLPADRAVLSGWTVKAVGRERDGMMDQGRRGQADPRQAGGVGLLPDDGGLRGEAERSRIGQRPRSDHEDGTGALARRREEAPGEPALTVRARAAYRGAGFVR